MSAKTPTLTLILAATPSLGIGKNGQLPWPMLKKEMAYFARVTKRVPPLPSSSSSSSSSLPPLNNDSTSTNPVVLNAVIMGRKTWDSIPARLRPLKGRLNVVITRDVAAFQASHAAPISTAPTTTNATTTTTTTTTTIKPSPPPLSPIEGPLVHSSLLSALAALENLSSASTATATPTQILHNIFVIGGASIYRTALELPATKRILLTKIHREYECDTFFSLNVEESALWRRAGRRELEAFIGESVGVDKGEQEEEEKKKEEMVMEEEQGVKFEFCLFEKMDQV